VLGGGLNQTKSGRVFLLAGVDLLGSEETCLDVRRRESTTCNFGG
jgi:hypothetical protein